MHTLKLRPGDIVLDWGGGCGHHISWLTEEFGAAGFLLDLVPKNIEWALDHTSAVAGCGGDASKLDYIPDNSVDHVIGFASFYILPFEIQCKLYAQQFMRILRPGGKVLVGW